MENVGWQNLYNLNWQNYTVYEMVCYSEYLEHKVNKWQWYKGWNEYGHKKKWVKWIPMKLKFGGK